MGKRKDACYRANEDLSVTYSIIIQLIIDQIYTYVYRGDEKTRLELGPIAESFPSNVSPKFAPLCDSDRRAIAALASGIEIHLDKYDLGQVLNVSTLGTEPKKVPVRAPEKTQGKTTISLKKIKLKFAGKKNK